MQDYNQDYAASPTYFPLSEPMNWDFAQYSNSAGVVGQYNELLQNAVSFYDSLETHSASGCSSGSEGGSRATPLAPRSAPKLITEVKGAIPDKIERRREQNRLSQRAYRDRREGYRIQLESQLGQWKARHRTLAKTYSEQTEQINRLKAQIEQLTREIGTLQCNLPGLWNNIVNSPTEFDLVPFFDPNSPSEDMH